MKSIFLGFGALLAAAVSTMSGVGIFIGIPLFFVACYFIIRGILQLLWGGTKLGVKGTVAGAKAMQRSRENS